MTNAFYRLLTSFSLFAFTFSLFLSYFYLSDHAKHHTHHHENEVKENSKLVTLEYHEECFICQLLANNNSCKNKKYLQKSFSLTTLVTWTKIFVFKECFIFEHFLHLVRNNSPPSFYFS